MRKNRCFAAFLTLLSFFVLFCASGCQNEDAAQNGDVWEIQPTLKLYMQWDSVLPNDGANAKNVTSAGCGVNNALKLFDDDINTRPEVDKDFTVTLDMGTDIVFSGIRYYADSIKDGDINYFGTRFYASQDNKNFVEVSVCDGIEPAENTWNEIEFSGYGTYRYFRAYIPKGANISEIKWMGTSNLNIVKGGKNNGHVDISLMAYDVQKDTDATILGIVFNKNNVMKKVSSQKHTFVKGKDEGITVSIDGFTYENDDSFRVVVLGEDKEPIIAAPVEYRMNGAASKFSVASVFGSNMMLQADEPIVVWGKAPKNRKVTVKLESKLGSVPQRTTTADGNSDWQVNLGSLSEGGDYTLTVLCDGQAVIYKNITIGDVWLCTGQSNMDYYMRSGEETAKELDNPENVKNSNIRIMNMWNMGIKGAGGKVENPPVGATPWREADADTIGYFSAVGYYFADNIQSSTGRPVGIINVAVGDTEINRWILRDTKCKSFTSTDGSLYNNRIYPLRRLAIKGVLLYQGEADQYRTHLSAETYSDALAGMIDLYRKEWGSDLPFYWAQLARYKVDESDIREGQRLALDKVSNKKNTGMISLIDIYGRYEGGQGSCREDIHPWNKKAVAERFANLAKRDCYGGSYLVGPTFKSAEKSGSAVVVTYESTGSLCVMDKQKYADKVTEENIKKQNIDTTKLHEFEIAEADGVFKSADAKIENNKVILTNSEVTSPMYVRYAWGAYPEMPNLTDGSGLPGATFVSKVK